MMPLCPRSNTYLNTFVTQTQYPGLKFDNVTGCISGVPFPPKSNKSVSFKVTGTNSFGSISTQVTLVIVLLPESYTQGAEVCFIPVDSPIPDLYPSFDTLFFYSNLTCHKQSSFSWADSYDKTTQQHTNPFLASSSSPMLIRIESYFYSHYSTPTTFTLSSTSAVLLYLNHYKNPILESITVDTPVERSVTIMLERGVHHLVAYTTSFSSLNTYSYFSLFFAYHCLGSQLELLANEHLVYPRSSPKDTYIPFMVGFESIPLRFNAISPSTLSKISLIQGPPTFKPMGSSQLIDTMPLSGSYDYMVRIINSNGERYARGSYRIEPKRERVLVTVSTMVDMDYSTLRMRKNVWESRRQVVMEQQVASFTSFTLQ